MSRVCLPGRAVWQTGLPPQTFVLVNHRHWGAKPCGPCFKLSFSIFNFFKEYLQKHDLTSRHADYKNVIRFHSITGLLELGPVFIPYLISDAGSVYSLLSFMWVCYFQHLLPSFQLFLLFWRLQGQMLRERLNWTFLELLLDCQSSLLSLWL